MSGIYLHIPFCKQACHYCNFHFSTSTKLKPALVAALAAELGLRKDYIQTPLQSIYFGGGTPSLLSRGEFEFLFDAIYQNFAVHPEAEITLEANPDDLSASKISEFRTLPFNRFSIGIQTFEDAGLKWMNRAHNAAEALNSVKLIQKAGYTNISIDLIYGIPGMTMEAWIGNIRTSLELHVPHISSYCLTVEPRTALGKMVQSGQQPEVDENDAGEQFLKLTELLEAGGLQQYEVSNFATPGNYSRHNTSYWKGSHYLGIGPSAHSFNGTTRSWNVANNARYIKALQQNEPFYESEAISRKTAYNEYMMTGLRTIWGVDLHEIKRNFNVDLLAEFPEVISNILAKQHGQIVNNKLVLNKNGFLFADGIASDFFLL